MKLVFEKGYAGRRLELVEPLDVPEEKLDRAFLREKDHGFPRCQRPKSAGIIRSLQAVPMG